MLIKIEKGLLMLIHYFAVFSTQEPPLPLLSILANGGSTTQNTITRETRLDFC